MRQSILRPFALVLASALFLSASGQGVVSATRAIASALLTQLPAGDYTDTPGTPYPGANPQVQPIDQGGLWDT